MLFPTFTFAVFFLFVFCAAWELNRKRTAWKLFMLAASYLFYGWWNWRFVGLIAASTLANHFAATRMERTNRELLRKTWLILAIALNLGSLAFFKYYNFFLDNTYAAGKALGIWPADAAQGGIWSSLFSLRIVLPVGISFFTFQAISYVVDIYRRQMKSADSLLDFAVYQAFFPRLAAGPIIRAGTLLPQIAAPPSRANLDLGRAASLILGGLFKKIIIANYLGQHVVAPVFDYPDQYAGPDILIAIYGFAVQIYCDFSAYSDIAIGVSLLLGLRIPPNFNAPYFATSIQHFWRRWHISLSTWLRDYLYIPLGGSRAGKFNTCRNVMITFLLGGLWHGAGWTFIVWGALHGFYLAAANILQPALQKVDSAVLKRRLLPRFLLNGIKMITVFHLVCLAWVFFKAETFGDAATLLQRLSVWEETELCTPLVLALLVVGLLSQFLDGKSLEKMWDRFNSLGYLCQGAIAAAILTAILALGPKGVAPFIYTGF